jgi:hypothetical protein
VLLRTADRNWTKRPIKLIRSIFLALDDRFYPPSELGLID